MTPARKKPNVEGAIAYLRQLSPHERMAACLAVMGGQATPFEKSTRYSVHIDHPEAEAPEVAAKPRRSRAKAGDDADPFGIEGEAA